MDSRMQHKLSTSAFVLLMAAGLATTACSNGSNQTTTTTPGTETAPAFVMGTDAPMASVVSFAVEVQSVNAVDANGNSVPLLSGTPTVDFARYNGLQTLLDMNDVPVGTYTSVSVPLGPPTTGSPHTQAGPAPP